MKRFSIFELSLLVLNLLILTIKIHASEVASSVSNWLPFFRNKSSQEVVPVETTVVENDRGSLSSFISKLDLRKLVPEATDAEIKNFLAFNKDDADATLTHLKSYIKWRTDNGILSYKSTPPPKSLSGGDESEDHKDWITASVAALNLTGKSSKHPLPRLARCDGIDSTTGQIANLVAKQNNKVIQVQPAQMDNKLAPEETYALSLALYLDRKLQRESLDKVTLCIDVRAGKGWPNPPAPKILPFIRMIGQSLETNFPERLHKCIVYPMPMAAVALWKVVEAFLNPETAKRFALVTGGAGVNSPAPVKMQQHIDMNLVEIMEQNRVGSFKGDK